MVTILACGGHFKTLLAMAIAQDAPFGTSLRSPRFLVCLEAVWPFLTGLDGH